MTQGTPTVAPIPATLSGVQCHVTLAIAQIQVQNQLEPNEIIGDALEAGLTGSVWVEPSKNGLTGKWLKRMSVVVKSK